MFPLCMSKDASPQGSTSSCLTFFVFFSFEEPASQFNLPFFSYLCSLSSSPVECPSVYHMFVTCRPTPAWEKKNTTDLSFELKPSRKKNISQRLPETRILPFSCGLQISPFGQTGITKQELSKGQQVSLEGLPPCSIVPFNG